MNPKSRPSFAIILERLNTLLLIEEKDGEKNSSIFPNENEYTKTSSEVKIPGWKIIYQN